MSHILFSIYIAQQNLIGDKTKQLINTKFISTLGQAKL